MNLILCGVLLVITVCVALYRKYLENHCDHYIHLHNDSHDTAIVANQEGLCKRMELMSRLQTYFIAATIIYAIVIVGMISYSAWSTAGNPT